MKRGTACTAIITVVVALCAAPAAAQLTALWQPVPISPKAVDDDPQLAQMQSWDLMVTTTGDWASAGLRAVLPPGNAFYNHRFGSNSEPNPALIAAFPGLGFDTYTTQPGDTG